MNKIFKEMIKISLVFIASGCMSSLPKTKHTTPFPQTFALLPFDNLSVDIDASFIMENLLESYIDSAGFDLQDRKITYEKLKTIGISDGGQLNSLTHKEIGKLLDVDALIYGEVREFDNKNIGVYYSRTVEVYIKLVDSKTGEILFETVKRKSNSKLGLSKEAAFDNLKTGYAQKVFEVITKSPLRQEADEVARMIAKEISKFRKQW